MGSTIVNQSGILKIYDFENHKLGKPLKKGQRSAISVISINSLKTVTFKGISLAIENSIANLLPHGRRLLNRA